MDPRNFWMNRLPGGALDVCALWSTFQWNDERLTIARRLFGADYRHGEALPHEIIAVLDEQYGRECSR